MKKTIFISRKLPDEAVNPLREKFNVRMWKSESEQVPRDLLLQEAAEADALWTVASDVVDKELLEAAPHLRIVANMAVGFNNIDTETAKKHNIIVTNTPKVLTDTTADLTFALLLSAGRGLSSAERELREGRWTEWTPLGFQGQDVSGAVIGIIGMGEIGEAVARRALGFDMKVLYHNRSRKMEAEETYGFEYREIDSLLADADFVVTMVPYTTETAGMIGERELSLMKKTAVLINSSRGGIVDENALYKALENGEIWAAGLDVFETEPVPLDNPLLTLPNVTALPHMGSATVKTRMKMMKLNQEAISAVLEGREPNNRVV